MSNKNRQNYPLEFKVLSVKLALDSDQSTAQTARDLGINPNSLYSWIDKYSNSNKNNQKNMAGNANSFE
jgi:transposase